MSDPLEAKKDMHNENYSLDDQIVQWRALANQLQAELNVLRENVTCEYCGATWSCSDVPDQHWRGCEKHPARAELDLRREAMRCIVYAIFGKDLDADEHTDVDAMVQWIRNLRTENTKVKTERDAARQSRKRVVAAYRKRTNKRTKQINDMFMDWLGAETKRIINLQRAERAEAELDVAQEFQKQITDAMEDETGAMPVERNATVEEIMAQVRLLKDQLAATKEFYDAAQKELLIYKQIDRENWEPFHAWAQSYLDAARWAGHDMSDAIKQELLQRDNERDTAQAKLNAMTKELRLEQLRFIARQEYVSDLEFRIAYINKRTECVEAERDTANMRIQQLQKLFQALLEQRSQYDAERDTAIADARALAQWIQTEREEWRALEALVSLHGHVKLSLSVPKMGADMETILHEHGAKYVEPEP